MQIASVHGRWIAVTEEGDRWEAAPLGRPEDGRRSAADRPTFTAAQLAAGNRSAA